MPPLFGASVAFGPDVGAVAGAVGTPVPAPAVVTAGAVVAAGDAVGLLEHAATNDNKPIRQITMIQVVLPFNFLFPFPNNA